MIRKIIVLSLLVLMASFVMGDDTPKVLFDFTEADPAKEWQATTKGAYE